MIHFNIWSKLHYTIALSLSLTYAPLFMLELLVDLATPFRPPAGEFLSAQRTQLAMMRMMSTGRSQSNA
jgi:hypothetical protein